MYVRNLGGFTYQTLEECLSRKSALEILFITQTRTLYKQQHLVGQKIIGPCKKLLLKKKKNGL